MDGALLVPISFWEFVGHVLFRIMIQMSEIQIPYTGYMVGLRLLHKWKMI